MSGTRIVTSTPLFPVAFTAANAATVVAAEVDSTLHAELS